MTLLQKLKKGFVWEEIPDILLYHGSKNGIDGAICATHPVARKKCDFGQGFYAGDNIEQVMGFICNHTDPFLYEMRVDSQALKHLHVDGMAWAFTVACFRRPEMFENHPIGDFVHGMVAKADVVSGKIADDNISVALNRFFDGGLTDLGLEYALIGLSLGNQYAFKTEKACVAINVISRCILEKNKRKKHIELSVGNREKKMEILDEAQLKFARKGLLFKEILERTKNGKRPVAKFSL